MATGALSALGSVFGSIRVSSEGVDRTRALSPGLFEVVPGVSSALAAPAAAGIPVTHRGLSASLTVVNGHDVDEHDWSALARSAGTLVFLMPVEHMENIAQLLMTHGRATSEPAAVVEWATTPRQRVVTAPLDRIAAQSLSEGIAAPAVLIVGPTAALVVAGTSVSDQVTFMANAGDTVQLVVGWDAVVVSQSQPGTVKVYVAPGLVQEPLGLPPTCPTAPPPQ